MHLNNCTNARCYLNKQPHNECCIDTFSCLPFFYKQAQALMHSPVDVPLQIADFLHIFISIPSFFFVSKCIYFVICMAAGRPCGSDSIPVFIRCDNSASPEPIIQLRLTTGDKGKDISPEGAQFDGLQESLLLQTGQEWTTRQIFPFALGAHTVQAK